MRTITVTAANAHNITQAANLIREDDWERHIEFLKSSVRRKVEHVFRIIKCQFGYRKTV